MTDLFATKKDGANRSSKSKSKSKQRRKQRSITTTDAEWNEIKRIAKDLNIPVSQLIVERVIQGRGDDSSPIPIAVLLNREVVRELLMLATIAKQNLKNKGQEDRLGYILESVEKRLDMLGL